MVKWWGVTQGSNAVVGCEIEMSYRFTEGARYMRDELNIKVEFCLLMTNLVCCSAF